jgi:energy-converting hydrogenase Eha subunit F
VIPTKRTVYIVALHVLVVLLLGIVVDLRQQLSQATPPPAPHNDFRAEREAMTERMKASVPPKE